MFIEQTKPADYDCGYNLDLMMKALPRISDLAEREAYAKRIVGLIKQSHPNWVDSDGKSELAWNYFYQHAPYNPNEFGIKHPFIHGLGDDAR